MSPSPLLRSTALLRALLLPLAALIGCAGAERSPRRETQAITPEELQGHVRFLSSDSLAGRRAGTPGNEAAAAYLERQMRSYGLTPGGPGGSFLQRFPFVAGAVQGPGNSLAFSGTGPARILAHETEFRTLPLSGDGAADGPLVFAGYGITDTSLGYDDYAGIDVAGAIPVVLRLSPRGDDPHSPFILHASLRAKAYTARERGAAGLLIVTGPLDATEPELIPFVPDQSPGSSGLPVMTIPWTILDSLLGREGKSLRAIQEAVNAAQAPSSFRMQTAARMNARIEPVRLESANVLGLLPGSDPTRSGEYIVLGAHYDHLGMGGQGSLAPDVEAVHHGADDNASGTAVLLEAAEYFASIRDSIRCSILFAGFSAEESGLLGSNHFVNNPTIPLASVRAMLNMDMVGRLRDRRLVVEGVGTGAGFDSLLRALNADSFFTLSLKPDGFGPSDHASFYGKDIPVLFFFTNLHSDYHRPTDTWEKLDYDGGARLGRYVARVARAIDAADARPVFARVAGPAAAAGDRRPMRVSMGLVPDYADDGTGLRITGVRPDSPADRCGLQAGDVIVKFAERTVTNIYDYTYILQELSPGDVVSIEVKRGDALVRMTATLAGR